MECQFLRHNSHEFFFFACFLHVHRTVDSAPVGENVPRMWAPCLPIKIQSLNFKTYCTVHTGRLHSSGLFLRLFHCSLQYSQLVNIQKEARQLASVTLPRYIAPSRELRAQRDWPWGHVSRGIGHWAPETVYICSPFKNFKSQICIR